MTTAFDLLVPPPPPAVPSYRWGTVTAVSPLTVILDGDPTPLPIVPTALVLPKLNDRVYCQIFQRQIVILGARSTVSSGGTTREIRRVGSAKRIASTTNATADFNIATVALPAALCVTGYQFNIRGVVNFAPDTAGSFTDAQIRVGTGTTTTGTQVAGAYVDHRIVGRIVAVSVEVDYTYDQTPGASNINVLFVGVPSNGALISASAARPSSLFVNWIVP